MSRRHPASIAIVAVAALAWHVAPHAAPALDRPVPATQMMIRHVTPPPSPAAPTEAIPTNPCEYEDGPGPCVWDAQIEGNGEGHSFWIDSDQQTHYYDPNPPSAN